MNMNNSHEMENVAPGLRGLGTDVAREVAVTESKLDGGLTDGKLGSMVVPAFTVIGAVIGAAVGAVAAGAAVHQMHKMNNDPLVRGSAGNKRSRI